MKINKSKLKTADAPGNRPLITVAMLACLLSSGCFESDPVRVEEDFGKAVRQMVRHQTGQADQPQLAAAIENAGMDGQTAVNQLEKYRAAQKKETSKSSANQLNLAK